MSINRDLNAATNRVLARLLALERAGQASPRLQSLGIGLLFMLWGRIDKGWGRKVRARKKKRNQTVRIALRTLKRMGV